jgi:hypothetical protein
MALRQAVEKRHGVLHGLRPGHGKVLHLGMRCLRGVLHTRPDRRRLRTGDSVSVGQQARGEVEVLACSRLFGLLRGRPKRPDEQRRHDEARCDGQPTRSAYLPQPARDLDASRRDRGAVAPTCATLRLESLFSVSATVPSRHAGLLASTADAPAAAGLRRGATAYTHVDHHSLRPRVQVLATGTKSSGVGRHFGQQSVRTRPPRRLGQAHRDSRSGA